MTPNQPRRLAIRAGIATAALIALSACGADVVDQQDVEQQISEKFGSEFDQVGDVSCPEDLAAEVDATVTCVMTGDGQEYDVDVTVTSIDGDKVLFDMEVK